MIPKNISGLNPKNLDPRTWARLEPMTSVKTCSKDLIQGPEPKTWSKKFLTRKYCLLVKLHRLKGHSVTAAPLQLLNKSVYWRFLNNAVVTRSFWNCLRDFNGTYQIQIRAWFSIMVENHSNYNQFFLSFYPLQPRSLSEQWYHLPRWLSINSFSQFFLDFQKRP